MKFEIGFEGCNIKTRSCRGFIEEAINDVFYNQCKGVLPQEAIELVSEIDNCEYIGVGVFRNRDTQDILPIAKLSGTVRTFLGMMLDKEQKYVYSQSTTGYTLWDEWVDRLTEYNDAYVLLDRYFEFENEENYKKLWSVHHNRFVRDYDDFDAFWEHYEGEMQYSMNALQEENHLGLIRNNLDKTFPKGSSKAIEYSQDMYDRINEKYEYNVRLLRETLAERYKLN